MRLLVLWLLFVFEFLKIELVFLLNKVGDFDFDLDLDLELDDLIEVLKFSLRRFRFDWYDKSNFFPPEMLFKYSLCFWSSALLPSSAAAFASVWPKLVINKTLFLETDGDRDLFWWPFFRFDFEWRELFELERLLELSRLVLGDSVTT